MPANARVVPKGQRPDPVQLRAVLNLVMSAAPGMPLHHSPASLSRSPAKVQILVNSLLVFIERGFADVTVQDLLDSAGISRRTFYKYFRNKVDVLESLYKLAIDIMVLRYRADVGKAAGVSDAAQRFVAVFFDYHHDLAPVIRLMQEEAIRHDSPLAPHRQYAMSLVVKEMRNELQRISGQTIDILVLQALLWALESTSIEMLRATEGLEERIAHAKRVMTDIVEASIIKSLGTS